MKKTLAMLVVAASMISSAPALRADTGSAGSGDPTIYHRNVPETPIWRNREFWRNEKERSGLPDFWQNTKNFFRRLNPAPHLKEQRDRYEARRTGTTA